MYIHVRVGWGYNYYGRKATLNPNEVSRFTMLHSCGYCPLHPPCTGYIFQCPHLGPYTRTCMYIYTYIMYTIHVLFLHITCMIYMYSTCTYIHVCTCIIFYILLSVRVSGVFLLQNAEGLQHGAGSASELHQLLLWAEAQIPQCLPHVQDAGLQSANCESSGLWDRLWV